MIDSKIINVRMYLLKAFAIVTVVLAHTNCDLIQNPIDFYLIKRLSAVGVFSFFFLSGYYFRVKDWKRFFDSNLKGLIIPWITLGSFNYLYGLIRTGEELKFLSYLKYILGSGSMYYFCTVLIILKILMNFICIKNKGLVIHYLLLVITVLSITISSVIAPLVMKYSHNIITPYLNVFNWIGIFALGIVAKEKNLISKYYTLAFKWKAIIFSCTLGFWIIGYTDSNFGYFGHYSFACELGMMIVIMEVLFMLNTENKGIKFMEIIGTNTLTVYLLHYPILSILQKSTILNGSVIFVFVRCGICVLLITAFTIILRKICKNKYLNWIKVLFGVN